LALPATERACIISILKGGKQRTSSTSTSNTAGGSDTLHRMVTLMQFNPQNASGNYRLDLADPTDFTVAERILIVDNWEAVVARVRKVVDTSQAGNYHAIRNFHHNGVFTMFSSAFMLPGDGFTGEGLISLDYVAMLRAEPGDEELSEFHYNRLKAILNKEGTDASDSSVYLALKSVSHKLTLSALHVGGILSLIPDKRRRIEAYCFLFPRCTQQGPPLVDTQFGVLGELDSHDIPCVFDYQDRITITERLGIIHTMDVLTMHRHPYNRFTLNLQFHDEHSVARYLLIMADLEPGENMLDTHWSEYSNRTSGRWFVPSTWTRSMPWYGIFYLRYVCEHVHDIRDSQRREHARSLLGWRELHLRRAVETEGDEDKKAKKKTSP